GGSDSETSFSLCSRAHETTIWLPVGIGLSFYEAEQTFGCRSGSKPAICEALSLDCRKDLVDQLAAVGELVVLDQVVLGALARLAVERHVQRDQPRAVEFAVACGRAGRLVGDGGDDSLRPRRGDRRCGRPRPRRRGRRGRGGKRGSRGPPRGGGGRRWG